MDYEVTWDGVVDGKGGELLFPRFSGYRASEVVPVAPPVRHVPVATVAEPWRQHGGQTAAILHALHGTPGWLTVRDVSALTGIPVPAAGSVLSRLLKCGQIEATVDPVIWHTHGRAGRGYRWKGAGQ